VSDNTAMSVILIVGCMLFILFWLFVCLGIFHLLKALQCKKRGDPNRKHLKAANVFFSLTIIINVLEYISSDLLSASLPKENLEQARKSEIPIAERRKPLEPFWEAARHTGYGRALDIAVQKIYGIERIDGGAVEAFSSWDKSNKKQFKPPCGKLC